MPKALSQDKIDAAEQEAAREIADAHATVKEKLGKIVGEEEAAGALCAIAASHLVAVLHGLPHLVAFRGNVPTELILGLAMLEVMESISCHNEVLEELTDQEGKPPN